MTAAVALSPARPFARCAATLRPEMTSLLPDNPQWLGAMMAAAQQGQAAPYRRLLNELRPWLVRYFARRLPPGSVDDAVQETLIAIHAKRHSLYPDRPASSRRRLMPSGW